MSDGIIFSGSVVKSINSQIENMVVVSGSVSSNPIVTISHSSSIYFRRDKQKRIYNSRLLGTLPKDVSGEYVNTGESTASFSTRPSWTHRSLGMNHSWVSQNFSSSKHEVQNLNTYESASSLAIGNGPLPVSASSYYVKGSGLVTKVYAVTASADFDYHGRFPFHASASNSTNGYHSASTLEFGLRPLYVAASGNYMCRPEQQCHIVEFNVPDYGIVKNVRVWLEFVHDVRIEGPDEYGLRSRLGITGIALRHPTLRGFHALPMLNDNLNLKLHNGPKLLHAAWGNFDSEASFYKDSFILWRSFEYPRGEHLNLPDILGSGVVKHLGAMKEYNPLIPVSSSKNHTCWDTDMDMRVVFDDASPIDNPRHLQSLYDGRVSSNGGIVQYLSGNSPNFSARNILKDLGDTRYIYFTGSAYGFGVPWFADERIKAGYLDISGTVAHVNTLKAGSPPDGWLNGPGGTAATNEFPTTGSQIGPTTIKPYLPMLDAVRQTMSSLKPQRPEALKNISTANFSRPGLRGSQVNGKWQLLLSTGHGIEYTSGLFRYDTPAEAWMDKSASFGFISGGIWFRQARLEITYEENSHRYSTTKHHSDSLSVNSKQYCILSGTEYLLSQSDCPGEDLRSYYYDSMVPNTNLFANGNGIGQISYDCVTLTKYLGNIVEWSGITVGSFTGSNASDYMFGVGAGNVLRTDIFGADKNSVKGRSFGINMTSSFDNAVMSRLTGSITSGTLSDDPHWYLNNEFGTPFIPISTSSLAAIQDYDTTSIDSIREDMRGDNVIASSNVLSSLLSRETDISATSAEKVEDRINIIYSGSI